MPLYTYECSRKKCSYEFEEVHPMSESGLPTRCPKCKWKAHRTISFGATEPTFTEKLYANGGFYHAGIGEVVRSESHLKERCQELGFNSKHEGARMNFKQERQLLSKRVENRPVEIIKKPTWSGRGAHLPTLDFFGRTK